MPGSIITLGDKSPFRQQVLSFGPPNLAQFRWLPARLQKDEHWSCCCEGLVTLYDCFYQDQDTLSYDIVNLEVQVISVVLRKCYKQLSGSSLFHKSIALAKKIMCKFLTEEEKNQTQNRHRSIENWNRSVEAGLWRVIGNGEVGKHQKEQQKVLLTPSSAGHQYLSTSTCSFWGHPSREDSGLPKTRDSS